MNSIPPEELSTWPITGRSHTKLTCRGAVSCTARTPWCVHRCLRAVCRWWSAAFANSKIAWSTLTAVDRVRCRMLLYIWVKLQQARAAETQSRSTESLKSLPESGKGCGRDFSPSTSSCTRTSGSDLALCLLQVTSGQRSTLCWQVKKAHCTFRLAQQEDRPSAAKVSCSAKQFSCVHPRHWSQYRFCLVVGRTYPPFLLSGFGCSLQRLPATHRTFFVGLSALIANGAAG